MLQFASKLLYLIKNKKQKYHFFLLYGAKCSKISADLAISLSLKL